MTWTQVINVSRWQAKVRAMFGLDGPNAVPTVSDLLPVAVIEMDRPEWMFAGAERPGGIFWSQAAVAAEFSVTGIINPSASGVLLIIESIFQQAVANVNLKIGRVSEFVGVNAPIDIAILSTEGREWKLDQPAAATLAPRLASLIRRGSLAAPLGLANGWFTHHLLPANTYTPDRWRVILPPGMVLAIEAQVAAAATQGNIIVRERPIEGGAGS